MSIRIRGSGVAAATCAHLLAAADFAVSWDPSERARVPSIMLSGAALALLRDVYGRPDLFAGKPRVNRRIVKWGEQEPAVLPHDAVIVSGADLQLELARDARTVPPAGSCNLTIFAASPIPDENRLVFGDRTGNAARVTLHSDAAAEECRMEALSAGWLFLVPESAEKGWLLGIGAPLAELLAESRLIAPVLTLEEGAAHPFATAPRLSMPLAGEDWLACGTPALRFDPICGDGTAQAVREAVLASAVIGGIAAGGDRAALLVHYRSMLVAAMRRHLDLCARFYAAGGQGEWWRAQTAALVQGYEACTAILARMPEPRFVLRGLALEPRFVLRGLALEPRSAAA